MVSRHRLAPAARVAAARVGQPAEQESRFHTADFDFDEFVQRYAALGCRDGRDGIEGWILERGWSNGEVVIGSERVWMRENAWWEAESMLDLKPMQGDSMPSMGHAMAPGGFESGYSANRSSYFPAPLVDGTPNGSRDQLVHHQRSHSQATLGPSPLLAPSIAPSAMRIPPKGDYGLGMKGDDMRGQLYYTADGEFVGVDPELADGKVIEERPITAARRIWVIIVWALTFWIPSPLLRYVGRMKRPDVRMAWREKLVLCFIIALINGAITFWIIWFGPLLCPNWDKAWSQSEVNYHQGANDFWVSIHGKVYDVTPFWRLQHSDIVGRDTDAASMMPLAGLNLDEYFVPPLSLSCQGLGIADTTQLTPNNSIDFVNAMHTSGANQPVPNSKLHAQDWYVTYFLPRIKEYYKGDLVWDMNQIQTDGTVNNHAWFVFQGGIYDLTDYFNSMKLRNNGPPFNFINQKLLDAVQQAPGSDITNTWNSLLKNARANQTELNNLDLGIQCIQNSFYIGIPDFRYTARCQANNYILLAFAIILCAVILIKFLSALQFGSKRRPAPQDKFVICQVPAYTEGEDSLRKALDSLTALQYDNKRKLICVICDGVIIGEGNDRPTPKIVLDILGVDPRWTLPPCPSSRSALAASSSTTARSTRACTNSKATWCPTSSLSRSARSRSSPTPSPATVASATPRFWS